MQRNQEIGVQEIGVQEIGVRLALYTFRRRGIVVG